MHDSEFSSAKPSTNSLIEKLRTERRWKQSSLPHGLSLDSWLPALPCLLSTSRTELEVNRSAIAKKAECLYVNIESLIKRVGLERVGFVTLTFSQHITDAKDAKKRFDSFRRGVLFRRKIEYIAVPERQASGRFHYHLVCGFPCDIRTGFNFDAYKLARTVRSNHSNGRYWDKGKLAEYRRLQTIYHKSANESLRQWWVDLRKLSAIYKFGRCETLPIINPNPIAVSRYLASYVTSASHARIAGDKGLRTVRYGLRSRVANLKFSWAQGNGARWRRGLHLLGYILEKDLDGLKQLYGRKFQYEMRETLFTLADGYANAIDICSKIPEWADHSSRVAFLARLLDSLRTEKPLEIRASHAGKN